MLLVSSLKDMDTKTFAFSFLNPFFMNYELLAFFPGMDTNSVEHGLYQCQCYPGLLQG